MDDVTYCARHPSIETHLRCQACDTPICPRCLVQTPVGAKCPTCARVRRSPIYELSVEHYARAMAGGLVAGALVGVVWGALFPPRSGLLGLVAFVAGLLAGYVVGEVISRAANRRRGPGLVAVAAGSLLAAYLLRNVIAGADLFPTPDLSGWVMAGIAFLVAAAELR